MEPSNPIKRGTPTSSSTLPEDNINVVVRVRPLNEKEKRRKDEHVIQFPGNGQLLVNIQINKKKFSLLLCVIHSLYIPLVRRTTEKRTNRSPKT